LDHLPIDNEDPFICLEVRNKNNEKVKHSPASGEINSQKTED